MRNQYKLGTLLPYFNIMGTTKFTIKISQEADKSFYAEVVELP